VEEQEIDEILLAPDFQAVLASNEGKHATHFQEEWLHSGEDRLFQLTLTVLIDKFQEVERGFVFDGNLRLVENVLRKPNFRVRLISSVFSKVCSQSGGSGRFWSNRIALAALDRTAAPQRRVLGRGNTFLDLDQESLVRVLRGLSRLALEP
jgi:hypothetical protein